MKSILISVAAVTIIGVAAMAASGGKSTVAKPPPAAPATSPADGEVMATINGQPIYMADIREILLYSYGVPIAEQLIANELVRQECQRLKVSVSDKDVAAANDKVLEQMFPTLDPPQRAKGLEETLVRKNVTRKQWDFTMRRNAQLAKLAEPFIKITEDDIQQAFGNAYDRKVVVRHIQLASLAEAQDVLDRLQGRRLPPTAQGKDQESRHRRQRRMAGADLAAIAMPARHQGHRSGHDQGRPDQPRRAGRRGLSHPQARADHPAAERPHRRRAGKTPPADPRRAVNLLQQRILLKLIQDAKAKGAVKFANPVLRELWEEAEKAKDSP